MSDFKLSGFELSDFKLSDLKLSDLKLSECELGEFKLTDLFAFSVAYRIMNGVELGILLQNKVKNKVLGKVNLSKIRSTDK